MSIPPDCVRVNIVWELPGPEIAVNTLNFQHQHQAGNSLDWANDMTQRYANLVRDGLASAWGGISPMHASSAKVARIDAYHLDTSGHTLHKATSLPLPATPLVGTGTGGILPLEVAGCLTLFGYPPGGFVPQARRKRGRIFLPGLSASGLDNLGRWGHANNIAQQYAAALSYMQLRTMDDTSPPVVSEKASLVVLSRTGGLATGVVAVGTDDLYDTQSRRQSALVPAKYTAAVT